MSHFLAPINDQEESEEMVKSDSNEKSEVKSDSAPEDHQNNSETLSEKIPEEEKPAPRSGNVARRLVTFILFIIT